MNVKDDIRQFRPASWVPWALGVAIFALVGYLQLVTVPESFAGEVTDTANDYVVVRVDTNTYPAEGDRINLANQLQQPVTGVITSVQSSYGEVLVTVGAPEGAAEFAPGATVTGQFGEQSFWAAFIGGGGR